MTKHEINGRYHNNTDTLMGVIASRAHEQAYRLYEKRLETERADNVIFYDIFNSIFGEMILRECIELLHEQERTPEGFFYAKGANIHELAILNHFGIKETKRDKFSRAMREALKNGIDLSGKNTP